MKLLKSNRNGFNTFPVLFDDLFNKDLFEWRQTNFSNASTTLPAVNIRENKENFIVEVAAPGMTKNDFKLELEGNLLTITSEKSSQETDNEDEKYTRKEFSYESFHRSFTLPKEVVDTEKINACYVDGVLQLLIPKKEEAKQKPPRLIEIG